MRNIRPRWSNSRSNAAALEQRLDGDHQAAELARLQQGLRDRDARDKFRELATAAKANPRALDMLWRLAEHRADTDEPDVKALQATLQRLKSEADYCFVREPEPSPAGQPSARESTPASPLQVAANNGFIFDRGQWSNTVN